ncbi:hypothetical protein [Micromonospora rubida]|uniref:hypothetical protein n=1 Tax=Micromonospora rubida TaxID=2697657 RepID=UPI001377F52C|nr:hypothetical protein [Micromonospora rubida]NBE84499.1 hypothetical protein [Micromonospora rubida]
MTSRDGSTTGGEERGPGSAAPFGTSDGFDAGPPWGAGEDSPMDEGSEETAVPEGSLGDRRAGAPAEPTPPAGRHGFGNVEERPVAEAGPGAPPDPAPSRRVFPNDSAGGDLPDNALEEATGMHPEGINRRG